MSGPKFSIIIPTHNRCDGRLQRALNSVLIQQYRDFECIVVDDASTDGTAALFEPGASVYSLDRHFRYIRHEKRQGRVVARNTGMRIAAEEGEPDFMLWMDSDDCLDATYLATFAYYAQQNPEARLLVCGSVVHGQVGEANNRICPAWSKIRQAWEPPTGPDGKYLPFGSGHVGTGSFVFARECYEKIGPMPDNWRHPDNIADGIDEWLGYKFGTLGYGSGKYQREVTDKPLVCQRGLGHVGNPWGDDFCYFAKLCQYYKVYLVPPALYIQYTR